MLTGVKRRKANTSSEKVLADDRTDDA